MIKSPWSGSRGKQSLPTPESHPRQPDSPTRRQKSSCAQKKFRLFSFFSAKKVLIVFSFFQQKIFDCFLFSANKVSIVFFFQHKKFRLFSFFQQKKFWLFSFFSKKNNQPTCGSERERAFFPTREKSEEQQEPGSPSTSTIATFPLESVACSSICSEIRWHWKHFFWEVFPKANLIRQEAQTKAFQKEPIRCNWKNPKTTIFKNTLILFPSLKLSGTYEKYFSFGQLGGSYCFHVPAKGSLFCIGWKLHEIRLYSFCIDLCTNQAFVKKYLTASPITI